MKKTILTIAIIVGITGFLSGQQAIKYSALYYHRASLFEKLPIHKSDIVFLGNSITHYAEWAEIFNDRHVKNRGISGDLVEGVYDRLDPIIKGQPKKIFLLIGVNNLARNHCADSVLMGIEKIAEKIMKESPRTKLYIQSVFPVNSTFTNSPRHANKGARIIELNNGIKKMCAEKGLTYIDVYPALKCKDSDELDPKYTTDGLHLNGDAYMVWKEILEKYL
ncbi:MAG: GDSL-type esterase/lipase family protein [Bacteroidales bacterium]|jgi:lysophospholipase L1-like esterase